MMTRGSNHAKKFGKWGEDRAQEWLEKRGYELVARNFHTEYGEIDLVMQKENCLHFVEVKTRRTKRFGNPEEAVTETKMAHMVDSAQRFLQLHPEFSGDWQIDVMAIYASPKRQPLEIRWIENVA
ncbi:MAG: YraN family protein [Anaerolineales bacterium]